MAKEVFLLGMKSILYQMANCNGNIVKRFVNVSNMILSFQGDCLEEEMQKKLERIKHYIQNTVCSSTTDLTKLSTVNIKKEKVKQIIDQLLEISNSLKKNE